jgi:altronate hydrolase
MTTSALTEKAILLRPEDDVALAKAGLSVGLVLEDAHGPLTVRGDIPSGHKIARRAVPQGGAVRRYGQVIGFATTPIAAGDHVHTHNLAFGMVERQHEVGIDVRPVAMYPLEAMRHFQGFRRADGRVGTRNYVAIVSTVNCSASVSQFVKQRFADVTRDYPNVDGVIAVTHKSGCAIEESGEAHLALQRVLAGYAKHPNVAAYVVIGLGCEVNQARVMVERQGMTLPMAADGRPPIVTIQESGGIRKAVDRAVLEVARLLPRANEARRTQEPVSEIMIATNCGGTSPESMSPRI